MTKRERFKYLGGIACGAVLAGTPAFAQAQTNPDARQDAATSADDSDSNEGRSQDIIVTAQRRAERLQQVPLAISALGGEALARQGTVNLEDIRTQIPSLTISTFAAVNASNLISIRGISGQPLPIGAGQPVAIYLDGVYLPRPDAGFFSLSDIERIEVLRGPQGTLYGRNATAGAVNIITRNPGKTLRASFDVSAGNYDAVRARADISGPISGGLSAGLSAAYDVHDGYFINEPTGKRLGRLSSYTLRGKLRYESEDGKFDATLTGDTASSEGEPLTKGFMNAAGVFVGIGDPRYVRTDIPERIKTTVKTKGGSLVLNYKLSPDWNAALVMGYRDIRTNTSYDGDASTATTTWAVGANTSKSFTAEARIVYDGDPLKLTLGANYFHEDGTFGYSNSSSTLPPLLTNPYDTTTLNAYAAFLQAEYEIVPKLTLVGGVRLNKERRDFVVDYTASRTPGLRSVGKIDDTAVLPTAGVNYKPTSDLLFYAKVGKGYQAPGFNYASGPTQPVNIFGAEDLLAYEAGLKTQFLNRMVTFNAAAFLYDYKDMQVRTSVTSGVNIVNNAGRAKVKGVEAELIVAPVRGFQISGQVTRLDARYTSFCEGITGASPIAFDPLCAPGVADRSGNYLNHAPKWNGAISANLDLPVSDGVSFRASASYSFQTRVYFSTANEIPMSNDGWERIDARAGISLHDRLDIYAYVRNLTDERYVGQAYRSRPTTVFGSISDPRTFGFGLRYRFAE